MNFSRFLPIKKCFRRPQLTPKNVLAALFLAAVAGLTYYGLMQATEDTMAIVLLAFVLVLSRRFLPGAQSLPPWGRRGGMVAFYLRILIFSLALLSVALINSFVPADARLGGTGLLRRSVYGCVAMAYVPLACALFLGGRARKIFFAVTYALVALPIVFLWGYFFLAHRWATADTVVAIWQTHPGEAAAFWSDQMGALGTLFALALIAAVVLCGRWLAHFESVPPRTKQARAGALALALLDLAVFGFFCLPKEDTYYSRIGGEGYYAVTQLAAFRTHHAQHADALAAVPPIAPPAGGVHVLVIGESHNRQFMHAYGGADDTTPWLDTMKDDDACILFTHAYSNHTYTVPALAYALTEKSQYNDIDETQALSLLEVAKAAGYQTAWISNQGKNGFADTPVSVIAADADLAHFTNEHQYRDNHHLDGELVAAFDDAVQALGLDTADANALIVVHLMDCHDSYDTRYPRDGTFDAPFDGTTPEGAYENAIRYNDTVMQSLYEHAKQLPAFRELTYFSDHSENLTNAAMHDPARYEPDMTYIPFYIFYAPEAAAARPGVFTALRANAAKPWTNDLAYELMATLLGLTPPHEINPADNIAGPAYDGDIARLRTCHGEREITVESE